MTKYLSLALIVVCFAGSSSQVKAGACCVVVPTACVPILRVPPETYVPDPAMLSPPAPISYSNWYSGLYEPYCRGLAEKDCIWACAPVAPKSRVLVKAGF